MEKEILKKLKIYGLGFVFYLFSIYLIFSFTFTINQGYFKNDTANTESPKAVTETVKTSNATENGIDKSKLSRRVNSGTNIANVLTDDEVVSALNNSSDADVKYILENREALNMNYLRLLNANADSKNFIKDILKNNKALNFKGESVEFERSIPYFLQWDRRWGASQYADGNIGINGCGPTCLAMVVSGLNKDENITPVTLAQFENSKYTQAGGTTWDYFREVPSQYGIKVKELSTVKNLYFEELKNGNPIILNVDRGDFTSYGHYIVLVGLDGDYFLINDPNSPNKSNERWTFERLAPQIKNAWSFSKEN